MAVKTANVDGPPAYWHAHPPSCLYACSPIGINGMCARPPTCRHAHLTAHCPLPWLCPLGLAHSAALCPLPSALDLPSALCPLPSVSCSVPCLPVLSALLPLPAGLLLLPDGLWPMWALPTGSACWPLSAACPQASAYCPLPPGLCLLAFACQPLLAGLCLPTSRSLPFGLCLLASAR